MVMYVKDDYGKRGKVERERSLQAENSLFFQSRMAFLGGQGGYEDTSSKKFPIRVEKICRSPRE